MQKITFISLYDEFCLDARYASAMLRHDGHETNFVFVKGLHYLRADMVPPSSQHHPDGYYGFDTFVTPKEMDFILKSLGKQKPDLVIFFFSSPCFGLAKFLTPRIKKRLSIPVLWAGADTAFSPEENILHADMICIGEPEHPLRHLVAAMDKKEELNRIEGIWVKQGEAIIRNPMLHLESVLDRFPIPDFEISGKTVILHDEIIEKPFPPVSHLQTNLIIRATRGNPFTCPYCQKAHDGLQHGDWDARRLRSADNVIDEIKYRLRTWPSPVERIEFHDEFFPLDREWVEHFTGRYSTEIALPFFGFTRPVVYDPAVFQLLSDAQMQALIIRISSGSPDIQKNYFHRTDAKEDILRMARLVMDSGMKALFEFLVHNPLEKEDDRKNTLDLLCDLPKGVALTAGVPMAFYRNCFLYQEASAKKYLEQIVRKEGHHAFQAVLTDAMVFWECLYTLAHFDGMEKQTVLDFVNDDYMRKKPQILQEMADTLYGCVYQDKNPAVNKEDFIHTLRWRITQSENDAIASIGAVCQKFCGK